MKKHNLIYYAIGSLKVLFLNNLEVFLSFLPFIFFAFIEIKFMYKTVLVKLFIFNF